jgi:hypothetical protein
LTYTFLERPPEVLWQQSLEFALGVMQNGHPLVRDEEAVRLFGLAVDRLINRRLYRKWLYDFGAADQDVRLRFVREFLVETYARFGWRPFPALFDRSNAIAELRARRQSAGLFEGEDLIIDSVLGDLDQAAHLPASSAESELQSRNDAGVAGEVQESSLGRRVSARFRSMSRAVFSPRRRF